MKKITLLVAAILFAGVTQAQITLTQNDGTTVTGTNSVGCPGGDNDWARNFVLADYGVTGNFQLESGTIGVQSNDASGAFVTVNVYSSDSGFPGSFDVTNLLGTQVVIVDAAAATVAVDYTFDVPVVVPAGTEAIVVAVVTELGNNFFIGGTAIETDPSYLRSTNCGVADYTTTGDIGFPDAHPLINVTGLEVLGLNENLAAASSIFPNPTSGELNVKLPSNVVVTSATVVDLLGRNTGAQLVNGKINMSDLAQGVYILKVNTESNGSLTQKVVKN